MKNLLMAAALMGIASTASAASVTTERVDDLANTNRVVTGVDFDGLATSAELQTVVGYIQGEDVHDIVTNYSSATKLPSRELHGKIDGAWNVWWKELTRWRAFLGVNDIDEILWGLNSTNFNDWAGRVSSTVSQKANRNWGQYDSETGELTPEGTVQISSDKITIGKSTGFQCAIAANGSEAWFLTSSDPIILSGGTAGEFTINPAGSTNSVSLFKIVRGKERTAPWLTDSMVSSNENGIIYFYVHCPITNAAPPVARFTADLKNPDWIEQGSSDCPCPSVTWSGTSGDWTMKAQAATISTNKWFATAYYNFGTSDDEVFINGQKLVTMTDVETALAPKADTASVTHALTITNGDEVITYTGLADKGFSISAGTDAAAVREIAEDVLDGAIGANTHFTVADGVFRVSDGDPTGASGSYTNLWASDELPVWVTMTNRVEYHYGTLVTYLPDSGDTNNPTALSFATNNWKDTAAVYAIFDPEGAYTYDENEVVFVSGDAPTTRFEAAVWRVGSQMRINVISDENVPLTDAEMEAR